MPERALVSNRLAQNGAGQIISRGNSQPIASCRQARALPKSSAPPADFRASCALRRRAAAVLPAASSVAPRTPWDRSAVRHRLWRNRASGITRLIGCPVALIAWTTSPCPFFILPIISGIDFVIGHAAVGETDHVGRGHRLVLIDDDARAVDELHAQRQRDAQNFLLLALRLDDDRRDHRLSRLDTGILAGEADFLGVRIRCLTRLAFETELRPRRKHQLYLLPVRRLTGRGWRRLRLPRLPAAPPGCAGFLGFDFAVGAGPEREAAGRTLGAPSQMRTPPPQLRRGPNSKSACWRWPRAPARRPRWGRRGPIGHELQSLVMLPRESKRAAPNFKVIRRRLRQQRDTATCPTGRSNSPLWPKDKAHLRSNVKAPHRWSRVEPLAV